MSKLTFGSMPRLPRPEAEPQPFGEWLRGKRLELELSQEALAGVFGCSTQTVARWEKGKTRCPVPGAIELAMDLLRQRLARTGKEKGRS